MSDMHVRNMSKEVHEKIILNAKLRRITVASYLEALLLLHERTRDLPREEIAELLESLGLQTVEYVG